MASPIPRAQITGLVLAGGQGLRLGGLDKGLQAGPGTPTLAEHALRRLAPQVGPRMVNANRHLDAYAAMGVPVCPDTLPGHPGPLAGILAGLERCGTPYLACVPCDVPRFPEDLVPRLAQALVDGESELAMAAVRVDGRIQTQPVFCLLRAALVESLRRALEAGERKVGRWALQHRCAQALFEDPEAFFNVNTPEELQRAGFSP